MAYYYYMDGQNRKGPVSLQDLVGQITLDSYIWTEGMANWQKASTVQEVVDAFNLNKQNDSKECAFDSNFAGNSYQNGNVNQQSNNSGYIDEYTNFRDKNSGSKKMENYFVLSLVCLLLCCVPFGIMGLINSRNSDRALAEGNEDLAQEYAQKAKKWAIAGFILGFIFQILYIMLEVAKRF